ncbi:MAG: MGMT family protein [Actinomycetota bacterium]|nr:MGMT family protein [Actinomycetota bacterium]
MSGPRPNQTDDGSGDDGADRRAFGEAVDAVLDGLGPGEVVTYGEVAAEAGFPGAARAVGTHLARGGGGREHPWWRVVTASGRLVPGNEDLHARLLRAEGVPVDGNRVRFRRERPGQKQ